MSVKLKVVGACFDTAKKTKNLNKNFQKPALLLHTKIPIFYVLCAENTNFSGIYDTKKSRTIIQIKKNTKTFTQNLKSPSILCAIQINLVIKKPSN